MNETRIVYTVFDEDDTKRMAFENEADAKIYAFDLALQALIDDPINITLEDVQETWQNILHNSTTDWGPFIEVTEVAAGWRDAING